MNLALILYVKVLVGIKVLHNYSYINNCKMIYIYFVVVTCIIDSIIKYSISKKYDIMKSKNITVNLEKTLNYGFANGFNSGNKFNVLLHILTAFFCWALYSWTLNVFILATLIASAHNLFDRLKSNCVIDYIIIIFFGFPLPVFNMVDVIIIINLILFCIRG